MQAVKDTRHLYKVERREYYAQRPGFRIAEMQISPTQTIRGTFIMRCKIRSTLSAERYASSLASPKRRCH